ncbi:MAG: hypothetical protein E7295_03820 [Lachnospiraceae bacterium]|nr:hypothetical protein [Lachnospiraceae bacterium]
MKLKALSHYDGDLETRFGDCLLVYDSMHLIVYDCGHEKHAERIKSILECNSLIQEIYIVVSHNDSDHTDGIIPLMEYLAEKQYKTTIYTSLYLKSAEKIEKILDDGRRNKKSICDHILDIFDRIAEIVERAMEFDFNVIDAKEGTAVLSAEIVGPSEDEFAEVVAKAIEDEGAGSINGETVMNAASVQLKLYLDKNTPVLLCGDASPEYLKALSSYKIIQFPHHGQFDDGCSILEKLGDASYMKEFIISDNTGNGKNAGGSEELVAYMKQEHYKAAYNTLRGEITILEKIGVSTCKGVNLGGFYNK